MNKKLLIPFIAAVLFWSFSIDAFAAVQLDDSLRPDNLPTIETVDGSDSDNPESAATQTLILFIGNLVSQVLLFVGTLALAFFVISGVNYILSFGKDEKIEKAKRGMFWSLIGLIIILLSYSIVRGLISIILQVDVAAT